jgi:hypothetical protein
MAECPAFTTPPARVHKRARALVGHHPAWVCRSYSGEIYAISHFRICSWCGCIHPGDLIDLLRRGQSSLASAAKPGKFWLTTPNPVAGDLVRMGSMPGRIFERNHEPADIRHRLSDQPKRGLMFRPTVGERLSGHFERPALEIAPATIAWPFYAEHTTDRQWPEIWDAAGTAERLTA